MNNEYIVKCGSYGRNLYLILDGEAVMFGINNELICILKSGTHFSNELEEDVVENYGGKRLCHLIAKSITVVGVLDQEIVNKLLEGYPFFKQLILKLNYALFKRCKDMLVKYKQTLGVEQTYEQEISMLENVSLCFKAVAFDIQ